MKESKCKPPSSSFHLLGLHWAISGPLLEIHPGKERVQRLTSAIQEHLGDAAASLAGKLQFATSWTFGSVGRALLRPLQQHFTSALSPVLGSALVSWLGILPQLRPARVALGLSASQTKPALVYADAFFDLPQGRTQTQQRLLDNTPFQLLKGLTNGWGAAVVLPTGERWTFGGSVPVEVLASAVSTKAYIFWLELIAQILTLCVLARRLPAHTVCFVDNQGAEHVLRRGWAKDCRLNDLLGGFWCWASLRDWDSTFLRVASAANLSDGPSRDSWEEVQSLGFTRLPIDFQGAWQLLLRAQNKRSAATLRCLVDFFCCGTDSGAVKGWCSARRP